MTSRKIKDTLANIAIYASSVFTVVVLGFIIGFIVVKGFSGLSIDFFTRDYENKTTYINARVEGAASDSETGYISGLGIKVDVDEKEGVVIKSVDSNATIRDAVDTQGNSYSVKKGEVITKLGDFKVDSAFNEIDPADQSQVNALLEKVNEAAGSAGSSVDIKIVRPGGGILPMLVTTVYMILLSLAIAGPVGIIAAIYLIEYAKPGKLMTIIHFAIENLAGIPSIIYGLFGSLVFVQILKMQYSILAGALTVSIILLPVIISTTEETLKAIPKKYRESSLGLGATQLQTVYKVILPNAVPGILVAVLLSIGRIVGESAALLLTAGTVAQIPGALTGSSASGATLTIKAYTLMKEENDLTTACAIGIILLLIIVVLNVLSKAITNKFMKKKGA